MSSATVSSMKPLPGNCRNWMLYPVRGPFHEGCGGGSHVITRDVTVTGVSPVIVGASLGPIRTTIIENVIHVWLSLIWVTDWLNTVTWLKHNSVCSPPQSCGGGTLIDTTECFHSGGKMAKWACHTIVSKVYVDRSPAVHCAQYTNTHCTACKTTPAEHSTPVYSMQKPRRETGSF